MAEVVLRHLKKIYPHSETPKKKHGKEDPSQKKAANLQITEEGVVAVQDFDMCIHDREFVVLVGPSGCGKSTTLRMIAGLEKITAGELYIDGELMNEALPRERDIAMVFQNYALYPHMTVYENLAFALKLQRIPAQAPRSEDEDGEEIPPKRSFLRRKRGLEKLPKAEIDAKVRWAADVLDISDLLKRKPKALSGGQRQRVAIGRAIVREPKVFLMDEPLSNLDAKLRNQMREEIIKLRQKVDTTFVYVTHDQTEAMTLGDRIVVMRDGYVQQIGTPRQVFERPANLFVAGFIGTPQMNFFRQARLAEGTEGLCLSLAGEVFPLSAAQRQALSARGISAGPVIFGLRPESLHLALAGQPGSISGKILLVELLGSQLQIHLLAQGEEVVLSYNAKELGCDPRKAFPIGAELHFCFSAAEGHLFDPSTEENLLLGE